MSGAGDSILIFARLDIDKIRSREAIVEIDSTFLECLTTYKLTTMPPQPAAPLIHKKNNAQAPGPAMPPEGRPLNVFDALEYLAEVRDQFHDRPDVYNYFLEIMMDFKDRV